MGLCRLVGVGLLRHAPFQNTFQGRPFEGARKFLVDPDHGDESVRHGRGALEARGQVLFFIAREPVIQIAGEQIPGLSRTYADVRPGDLVAYVGSSGYLEIAVREGSAATRLGADVGHPVQAQ